MTYQNLQKKKLRYMLIKVKNIQVLPHLIYSIKFCFLTLTTQHGQIASEFQKHSTCLQQLEQLLLYCILSYQTSIYLHKNKCDSYSVISNHKYAQKLKTVQNRDLSVTELHWWPKLSRLQFEGFENKAKIDTVRYYTQIFLTRHKNLKRAQQKH